MQEYDQDCFVVLQKMPSQIMPDGSDVANNEIKVKTAYSGKVMISYIKENITYDELCFEIRKNCNFTLEQVKRITN